MYDDSRFSKQYFRCCLVGRPKANKAELRDKLAEIVTGMKPQRDALDSTFLNVFLDYQPFEIFDTAGSEYVRHFCPMYVKRSDGGLFVYNVNDQESFNFIKEMIDVDLSNELTGRIFTIVGNCIEDPKLRQVSTEEGWSLASQQGMQFFEVSLDSGINVKECFLSLINPKPIEPLS